MHPTGRFIKTPQIQFSYNKYSKDLDLHPSDIKTPLFKKYSYRRSEFRSSVLIFAESRTNKSANSERENLRKAYSPCAASTKIPYRAVTVTRESLSTLHCYKRLHFSAYRGIHPYFRLFDCCLVQSLATNFLENGGLCAVTWIRDQFSDHS